MKDSEGVVADSPLWGTVSLPANQVCLILIRALGNRLTFERRHSTRILHQMLVEYQGIDCVDPGILQKTF